MAYDSIDAHLPEGSYNGFAKRNKGQQNKALQQLSYDLKCVQKITTFEGLGDLFDGTSYEGKVDGHMSQYGSIVPRFESIYGQTECPHDEL